jgi:hypothetical protein
LTRLLHFRCLLPLLLSCASLPASPGPLTSAWPRIDIHDPLNAVAPAQPATKLLLLPNFASPATTGDGTSDFRRIMHPAARAVKRISDFHRTFTFLRGRKCSFPIATLQRIYLLQYLSLYSEAKELTAFRWQTNIPQSMIQGRWTNPEAYSYSSKDWRSVQ